MIRRSVTCLSALCVLIAMSPAVAPAHDGDGGTIWCSEVGGGNRPEWCKAVIHFTDCGNSVNDNQVWHYRKYGGQGQYVQWHYAYCREGIDARSAALIEPMRLK